VLAALLLLVGGVGFIAFVRPEETSMVASTLSP